MYMEKDNIKLLSDLRDEVLRIGIQENPTKTLYTEKYNREEAPSAMTALNRLNMTWAQIMRLIGFDYIGQTDLLERRVSNAKFVGRDLEGRFEFLLEKISDYGMDDDGWLEMIDYIEKRNVSSIKKGEKVVKRDRTDEERLDAVVKFVVENNIRSAKEYIEKRPGEVPSMSHVVKKLGGWKNIKHVIKERHGIQI